MYGSADTDPVVKWYDVSFALGSNAELDWYLHKAQLFGGPILDLACGTGRLALMWARHGYEVTGLDQSMGMLTQFQRKLAQEPPQVQQRIQIAQQRISVEHGIRRIKAWRILRHDYRLALGLFSMIAEVVVGLVQLGRLLG